jgi:hypothetical protein
VVVLAACGSAKDSSQPPGTPSLGGATPSTTTTPAATGLPALDSAAPVWRFPPPAPADPARVSALEAALGGPAYVAGDPQQSWTYAPAAPTAAAGALTDPRAVATAVWTAAAVDPSTLEVSLSADGTTVTGTEQLAGVPSPLPFLVAVDGTGKVTAASGHLAVAEPAGDEARIGTAAAMGLLSAAPAGDDRGEQQPSLRPDATPAVTALAPQPTTEPTVVDRMLKPVTAVAETYVLTTAPDGGALLVPAYHFTFDDGSTRTVTAVATPSGGGPVQAPEFVGLSADQAAAAAAAHGWAFRVAERDGVEQMLTADFNEERVNVAVANGAVTRAWMG